MENAALLHPRVALAAVIAIPHQKWDERPLLLVKAKAGCTIDEGELRDLLGAHFAKWELPDAILVVDDIPLGATGKIDKKLLRERYAAGGAEGLRTARAATR